MKTFAALGMAMSLFVASLGIAHASEEPAACQHYNVTETTTMLREWPGPCDKDNNCIITYTEYIKVHVCSSCGKYMGDHRWTYYKHSIKH